MADLQGTSVEARMIDVEQAQLDAEAAARLSELRTQLGLPAPVSEAPAPEPTPTAAEQPAQQPATGGSGEPAGWVRRSTAVGGRHKKRVLTDDLRRAGEVRVERGRRQVFSRRRCVQWTAEC